MNPYLSLGEHPAEAPRFTRMSEEQAQALVVDREVAIVAGAGAGKTSTLAARYVLLAHTLLQRTGVAPDPRAILVLTFTERAATEMRERCLAMVNAMADESRLAAAAAGDGATRAAFQIAARGWAQVRDRFPAAAISTFHGFCSRLLREYPAETRTIPGTRLVDDATAQRRMGDAALEAVMNLLDVGGPDAQLALATWGGAAAMVDHLRILLGRRGELRDTLVRYAAGPTSDADLLAAGGITSESATEQLDVFRGFVGAILASSAGVDTPWLGRLRAARDQLAAPLPSDPLEAGERLAMALTCFVGSNGVKSITHHSAMGAKAAYGHRHPAAVAALKAVQADLSAWEPVILNAGRVPTRHDRTLARVQCLLGRLVLDAQARLVARYDSRGELDFTELIARARRAVVEGSLARVLRERHPFVMVDEFQDTDVDQWALVEAITRVDGAAGERLFVVGDPKQSIYGFRGGDVAVFERARRTIAHRVVFADNHRSRPAIVAFANQAFSSILSVAAGADAVWQVGYDAMRAASPREGGSVVLATANANDLAADDVAAEAAWIARTVRDEVLRGQGPWIGTNYADLKAYPKPPIAILLRRRSNLEVFEAALRELGVGAVVADGSGFWRRQEVLDLAHTLRALVTGNPLSVVGALRSPLFGLPDRLLVELSKARKLDAFGEGEAPESADPRIGVAWSRWAALRDSARRLSIARTLERILDDAQSSWLLAVESPDGRAEGNVVQLLRIADQADREGTSPVAFAQSILDRAAANQRESEAALPDSGARVVLLTIHASKGLEYPVVIVPELGSRLGAGRSGRVVTSRGAAGAWEITMPVPDPLAPVIGVATPSALVRARDVLRDMEFAELRRVFYVACTRAQDHLILVGHRAEPAKDPGADPRSWLDMLDAADLGGSVELTALDGHHVGDVEPSTVRGTPREAYSAAQLDANLKPLPSRRIRVLAPSALEACFALANATHATVPRPPTATGKSGAAAASPDFEAARAIAAVRGTVLHGLLEDECIDDDTLARERWYATARGEGLDEDVVARGWAGVRRQLAVMRESEDVAMVLDSTGMAELPVRLDTGNIRIEGRLDRLCRDRADGAWMIVDYKTEDPGEFPETTAARHRVQLLAYSVAASGVLEGHGRERVRRAAVLFTRTGQLVRLSDWSVTEEAEFLRAVRALPSEP